jgi:hypothetical protein
MNRWITLLGAAALLLVLVSGCTGTKKGTGIVNFSWPTSGAMSGIQSLKLEVRTRAGAVLSVSVVNRPTDNSMTAIPVLSIPTGNQLFLASGYSGKDTAGSILAQGYGQVMITTGVPIPTYVSGLLDPSAYTTLLLPTDTTLYVNAIVPLYAIVRNPDNAVVLIPPGTLTWHSNKTWAATVGESSGILTGIASTGSGVIVTISVSASPSTLNAETDFTVKYHLPTVSLTASSSTILLGQSVTLTWSSTYASSVQSTAGTGFTVTSSTINGNITLKPTVTTTYRITMKGAGGDLVYAETTVAVTQPAPTVSITATPQTIAAGGSTSLTWSCSNATSCVVSGPGVTSTALNGTLVISPSATVTYTITATGLGGTTSESTTITVN